MDRNKMEMPKYITKIPMPKREEILTGMSEDIIEQCETGEGYALLGRQLIVSGASALTIKKLLAVNERLENLDCLLTRKFSATDTSAGINACHGYMANILWDYKYLWNPSYDTPPRDVPSHQFVVLLLKSLLLSLSRLNERVKVGKYRGNGRYCG